MLHGLIEKLLAGLERRAQLLYQDENESAGWRQLVFNGVFLTLVILGGVSYLPTFLNSLQRGMWGTVALYSLVYIFGFSVLLLRRMPFRLRAAIGVLGIYLIGVCTLDIAGLAGSGRIWLFCFPILTCLFLGLGWGLAALGLNVLTMAFFAFGGEAMRPAWDQLYLSLSHQQIWAITSGTLILLNATAIVSLAFVLRGLEASLKSSRRLQDQLKDKHTRLQSANQALGREIRERRRAQAQLVSALGDRERMLKEMHHRVNNHMQVVSSMLSLSRAKISDIRARELVQESQHRVRAVGLIHESMYRSGRMAQVSLDDYIKDLARNLFNVYDLESRLVELEVKADPISLSLDQAVPFGLVLNELMTNTLKHAFNLGMGGRLLVSARQEPDNMIELMVSDNGMGLPSGFQVGEGMGMGLYLVKNLAENQLHGEFELSGNQGVRVRIKFKRLQDAGEGDEADWAEQPGAAAPDTAA